MDLRINLLGDSIKKIDLILADSLDANDMRGVCSKSKIQVTREIKSLQEQKEFPRKLYGCSIYPVFEKMNSINRNKNTVIEKIYVRERKFALPVKL